MEWEFFRMVIVIGAITLVLQLGMAVWENKKTTPWSTPVSLWQVLGEWAVYIVIFILASILLYAVLPSELVRSIRNP